MRFNNNIGRMSAADAMCSRWSQSTLAARLELAGFDISHSGVSKLERGSALWTTTPHVPRGSVESSYPGAFPATRKRGAPIRLYRL
jgi:hypothetical protein